MNANNSLEIIVGKGYVFELIVEFLLKQLYPQYNFKRTQYIKDGGKDFYTMDDNEQIWAEAKCHKAHLELQTIAGTFILADIYQVNKVLIFSVSQLTSGALANLSRYCTLRGKTLIVFHGQDIIDLIKKFISHKTPEDAIELLYQSCTLPMSEQDKQKLAETRALIQNLFYNILFDRDSVQNPKNLKSLDPVVKNSFYDAGTKCNLNTLEDGLRAYEVFCIELIIRNHHISDTRVFAIEFKQCDKYAQLDHSARQFVLEPGQTVMSRFYFRVFNQCRLLSVPNATVTINGKTDKLISIGNKLELPCRLIGETPYIGIDKQSLDMLHDRLIARNRYFATVLLYGKSGVGKTRFLYELKVSREEEGNLCFTFDAEKRCDSIYDFMRQLLLGYYDISFDIGRQELSWLEKRQFKTGFGNADLIQFICDVINDKANAFNDDNAKKWMLSFLKNHRTTILIDNAQSINGNVFKFVNDVMSELQTCVCGSEIVFVFNTDLISPERANHFRYYKDTLSKEYIYEIKGFDKNTAKEYLKLTLDPAKIRDDIDDLCNNIITKTGGNPLYLKQFVLYLYQENILCFENEHICFKSLNSLATAINDLPQTIHDTIVYRFKLLMKSLNDRTVPIKDLFWAITIFGEMPRKFIKYITGIDNDTVNQCIELGFIKYSQNGKLVFEHQLIAKSILIYIQNMAYFRDPEICEITLSECTAKNFSEADLGPEYETAKFIIKESVSRFSIEDYERFLSQLSLYNVNLPLIKYIVGILEKYNIKLHDSLSYYEEIKSVLSAIMASQNRLGVNKSKTIFHNLIQHYIKTGTDYKDHAKQYIELLRFYFYELPPLEKETYLQQMSNVCIPMLSDVPKADFEIWVNWAIGKNRMQLHKFDDAKTIMYANLKKAIEMKNTHREAEIEVQLGYLYSYLHNKESAIEHFKKAADKFEGDNIFNRVVALVCKGSATLLESNYDATNAICRELLDSYYGRKDSYSYLKAIIDDLVCNLLIRKSVDCEIYDRDLENETQMYLTRFRTLALTYETSVYLHAAYKTIVYCKFMGKKFSHLRSASENERYLQLIEALGADLLYNYDAENSDINYFLPVIMDILSVVPNIFEKIDKYIPQLTSVDRLKIKTLCNGSQSELNTNIKYGIFSDPQHKVNLFHYSYIW